MFYIICKEDIKSAAELNMKTKYASKKWLRLCLRWGAQEASIWDCSEILMSQVLLCEYLSFWSASWPDPLSKKLIRNEAATQGSLSQLQNTNRTLHKAQSSFSLTSYGLDAWTDEWMVGVSITFAQMKPDSQAWLKYNTIIQSLSFWLLVLKSS